MIPLEAEAWALLEGIKWIHELGYQNVEIEIDCKSIVDDLLNCNRHNTNVHILVSKCKEVLNLILNSLVSFIWRQTNNFAHRIAHYILLVSRSLIIFQIRFTMFL
ncbi:hypothetical protein JHK86_007001 [Glycine max]|uniref:RNase H type-1 domain-containing protein n=1 Tax=Glycine max TaxID=3847 RepID=A0A0R0KGW3_SOYBN|nr:hypothetical protein JHK86_007001 [Glycine max]